MSILSKILRRLFRKKRVLRRGDLFIISRDSHKGKNHRDTFYGGASESELQEAWDKLWKISRTRNKRKLDE